VVVTGFRQHPAILSKGGLGPAVPVRRTVDVPRRLPENAEVAGYYVVAEALTNVAKHAAAPRPRCRSSSRATTWC